MAKATASQQRMFSFFLKNMFQNEGVSVMVVDDVICYQPTSLGLDGTLRSHQPNFCHEFSANANGADQEMRVEEKIRSFLEKNGLSEANFSTVRDSTMNGILIELR